MSSTDDIIPGWIWKRRWSSRFNRNSHVIVGLILGTVGLIIVIAAFYVREDIFNVCQSPTGCPQLWAPGTQLADAFYLLEFFVTTLGVGISSGGYAYAILTLRINGPEWAAAFGLQPIAKRLQQWYSQGRLSRQQVDELLADLTASIRRK